MERKTIIGIITILVLSSVAPSYAIPLGNGPITSNAQYHDYNFTTLAPGSFPANGTWVKFSVKNGNSVSTIGGTDSSQFNGLLVLTNPESGSPNTYFDANISTNASFNIVLTFSWSYQSGVLFTDDNIGFYFGGVDLLNYAFGPWLKQATYINGTSAYNIGMQPPTFSNLTVDLEYNSQTGIAYTGLSLGYNTTLHFPYLIKTANPTFNGYLNVLIGGATSNLTLYNMFLTNKTTGFEVPTANGSLTYTNETISLNNTSSPSFNYSQPNLDLQTNSILYFSNGTRPGVYSYNYYNNSVWELFNTINPTERVSSFNSGQNIYYFIPGNGAFNIVTVNLSNGIAIGNEYPHDYPADALILHAGNSLYLVNGSARILWINQQLNDYGWCNVSNTVSYRLFSSSVDASSVYLTLLNQTSDSIQQAEILDDTTIYLPGTYQVSYFDSTASVETNNSMDFPGYGELNATNGLGGNALFFNGSALPSILNNSVFPTGTTSGYLLIKNGNYMSIDTGSDILSTNIPAGLNSLTFNDNLTVALTFAGDNLTVYSQGSIPFSTDGITVNASTPAVLSGTVSIPYTVESSLGYSISASLGNFDLKPVDGYINFSTAEIPNGTYRLSLSASNAAGYSSTVTKEVAVDNYVPILTAEPGNNSYIQNGATISFSISNLSGSITTIVSFANGTQFTFSSKAFNITLQGRGGQVSISMNVTDQFGIVRHFYFSYDIIVSNTSGFRTNLPYGAFLASGSLNLSWSRIGNVSIYTVSLFSPDYGFHNSTALNYSKLSMPSGNYFLIINATLIDGKNTTLTMENFTVQSFSPELNVSRTGLFYSFFGDSLNDTMTVNATTNVTTSIWLNISSPDGQKASLVGYGDAADFALSPEDMVLDQNGTFYARITAQELSGLTSSYSFNFSVNNRLPSLSYIPQIIYTNTSDVKLPLERNASLHYYYILSGLQLSNGSELNGSIFSVSANETRFQLVVEDLWGNVNETNVTVVYSTEKPVFRLSTPDQNLVWTDVVRISYSVDDSVALTDLHLYYGNQSIRLPSVNEGSVNVSIGADGNVSFYLEGVDVCGNWNESMPLNVTIAYFPEISSINPGYSMLMGFASFSAGIAGEHLESVNVTWFIDQRQASTSYDYSTLLMPGFHNVTLIVSYHGKETVVTKHLLVLGFLPEAGMLAALAAFVAYRRYSGRPDMEAARNLVRGNLGKPLKEIIATSRKNKIRAKAVTNSIQEMQSVNEVSLKSDPDGTLYVMPGKRNRD